MGFYNQQVTALSGKVVVQVFEQSRPPILFETDDRRHRQRIAFFFANLTPPNVLTLVQSKPQNIIEMGFELSADDTVLFVKLNSVTLSMTSRRL